MERKKLFEDMRKGAPASTGTSDSSAWSWEKQNTSGASPEGRSAHCATSFGDNFIIFGGYDGRCRNDVCILDTRTWIWKRQTCGGTPPSARYAHSATNYDNKMIVFGGWDGSRMHDVHSLDSTTWTWQQLNLTGVPPSKRAGQTATLYKNKLVIFGGNDGVYKDDLKVIDLDKNCWISPTVSGTQPGPRSAHSARLFGDKLVIFGGNDGKFRNDVRCLKMKDTEDCTSWTWQVPKVQGRPPSARYAHSSCCSGQKLVVFGGCDVSYKNDTICLDTSKTPWQWSAPATTGLRPSARYGHSLTRVRYKLLVFGGKDDCSLCADVFSLDTGMREEEEAEAAAAAGPVSSENAASTELVLLQFRDMSRACVEQTETKLQEHVIAATAQLNATVRTYELAVSGAITRLCQRLEEKRATFEEYRKLRNEIGKSEDPQRQITEARLQSFGSSIRLNIGGTRFTTTLQTLTCVPGSMLALMFSGEYSLTPDPDGSFFIDRSPVHFPRILDMLRLQMHNGCTDSSFVPRTREESRALLTEAEFYGLEALAEPIRAVLGVEEATTSP
eukprot:CAMPEP_0114555702 /NCGR_PEP_ID=MMETSP0114-20121206/8894_1 /TAXON_ID=31324 /ORGANISM="Goniomonas sp, Strain m" /LENGTH=556 /DNA_ID=CAMNT_0001740853 /DNA_START=15 /DNA_END=1685 /DNA_ORIENTATION=-